MCAKTLRLERVYQSLWLPDQSTTEGPLKQQKCFLTVLEAAHQCALVSLPLVRALALLDQGPTPMTSFHWNTASQAPSPSTATLRVRASISQLEETNVQSPTGREGHLRNWSKCGESG